MLHFRLQLRIQGIHLQGNADGRIVVTIAEPRPVEVLLENPRKYGDDRHGDAIATAYSAVNPPNSVTTGFVDLSNRRLPQGIKKSHLPRWQRYQEPDGSLRDIVLPRSLLPKDMADLIHQTSIDLAAGIRRAAQILRWRYSLDGPHNPLRRYGYGAEWSLDRTTWHPLPQDTSTEIHPIPWVYPTMPVAKELQTLLDVGADEPIAHQVFREAWEHRHSGRRSSLVIAVAALEVGTKLFLARVRPDNRWLLENIQTPSTPRLLSKYLPTLVTPLTIGGKTKAPPRRVLKLIEKAVVTRNRVAHSTGEEVSHDGLRAMLEAVRDVLWLLDYYAGNSWALSHVSKATLGELKVDLPDDAA